MQAIRSSHSIKVQASLCNGLRSVKGVRHVIDSFTQLPPYSQRLFISSSLAFRSVSARPIPLLAPIFSSLLIQSSFTDVFALSSRTIIAFRQSVFSIPAIHQWSQLRSSAALATHFCATSGSDPHLANSFK